MGEILTHGEHKRILNEDCDRQDRIREARKLGVLLNWEMEVIGDVQVQNTGLQQ